MSWNKLDRTGKKYGKLVAIRQDGPRWVCRCMCGNEVAVLSTNLSSYSKSNRGCKHCAHRKDITAESRGLLTAESVEDGVVTSRPPIWTFRCKCGGSIRATVREFRANFVRSCGCHDSTYNSWVSMMGRCYEPKNIRFNSYGGRGIRVCRKWHSFDNFAVDMGERPKRHNLGRKKAEEDYSLENCQWEHISVNCRDTDNYGSPTKPGLLKGAKHRKRATDE